jgi:hypothetical protein
MRISVDESGSTFVQIADHTEEITERLAAVLLTRCAF